jgi:hypothetical protein
VQRLADVRNVRGSTRRIHSAASRRHGRAQSRARLAILLLVLVATVIAAAAATSAYHA